MSHREFLQICRELLRMIDEQPTIDAVEVVRCKDCKHNAQPDTADFAQCELDALMRDKDWFCKGGERRKTMAFKTAERVWPGEAEHVYQELDQIRLVWENGKLVGWYRPGDEE